MQLDDYAQLEELRESNKRLLQQLRRANAKTEDLVNATIKAAKDATLSMGPIPEPQTPVNLGAPGKPEVALWHLTDWQGGKRTAGYNFDVMHERVQRFLRKAYEITDIQRAHHPIEECVILFGGDMVEGLFNFPQQAFEIDGTLHEQFVRVSRLVVSTVLTAMMTHSRVKVISEWGNHGRLGNKNVVLPKYDNLDRMVYELARQLINPDATISLEWTDSVEDIQRVEIGNYRALLIHGDEVGRNGYASDLAIVRHADRWRSGAYPWDFRDVYVGHYHQHKELPMANGRGAVYFTGSTESENHYAQDNLAASAEPTQRLHFIDPVRGRVTSQHKIYLQED